MQSASLPQRGKPWQFAVQVACPPLPPKFTQHASPAMQSLGTMQGVPVVASFPPVVASRVEPESAGPAGQNPFVGG
jgi:hypothetical protein